ncbi:MAG: hypothetical protein EOP73_22095, partial [Variovorax sp.]
MRTVESQGGGALAALVAPAPASRSPERSAADARGAGAGFRAALAAAEPPVRERAAAPVESRAPARAETRPPRAEGARTEAGAEARQAEDARARATRDEREAAADAAAPGRDMSQTRDAQRLQDAGKDKDAKDAQDAQAAPDDAAPATVDHALLLAQSGLVPAGTLPALPEPPPGTGPARFAGGPDPLALGAVAGDGFASGATRLTGMAAAVTGGAIDLGAAGVAGGFG